MDRVRKPVTEITCPVILTEISYIGYKKWISHRYIFETFSYAENTVLNFLKCLNI